MAVYGVDIHARYQAGISFAQLKKEGYSFAVMKFTEGTGVSYLNTAKTWVPAIRQQGMLPGGYHWIKAGDGAAQARFFYDHVKVLGGPKGMLIQLDCEDNATQADVTEWVNEWNRLSGRHPFLIYSGGWWWKPRGWTGTKWTPYLWNSHYLSADANIVSDNPATFAARIPDSWWNPGYGGWSQATILQFTSRGDAGSLGNNVDLNVYRGTMTDLKRLAGIQPTTLEDDVSAQDVWEYPIASPALGQTMPAGDWIKRGEAAFRAASQAAADAAEVKAMIGAVAARVDIDPEELAAIGAEARAGAQAGVVASVDVLADAIAARIPDADRAMIVAAVREVFADAGTPA